MEQFAWRESFTLLQHRIDDDHGVGFGFGEFRDEELPTTIMNRVEVLGGGDDATSLLRGRGDDAICRGLDYDGLFLLLL